MYLKEGKCKGEILMGFYCSTQIVNDKNNVLHTINTKKYGIGYGMLCFGPEDFTVDVPGHVYVAKTPVKKAAERISHYYREFVSTMNQKILDGMEYDEWSQRAIKKAIDFLEKLQSVFKDYPNDYVYADLSEGTYLYEKTEDIQPYEDVENQIQFVRNILNGCYLGRYPDEELEKKAEAFIKQFKEGLLKFDSILGIENFGSIYEPCFFVLGNQKMMKFKIDIKVSTESIEEDYQIFDKALLPLRPYFIQNSCDYEQDFSAGYVRKEGKMRLIIYKLLEA